ncbi:MAG TPA: hypothetical protein VEX63_12200 [Flavisolibacter sp.]|nr:hypothetical protein [Flavisolibacter sp.]
MKAVLLFLFIFINYYSAICQFAATDPDTKLKSLAKKFIGYNPYSNKVGSSIDSLLKDIHFKTDTLIQRTDTSLFYIRGLHTLFKPFTLQLDSVKSIVAEVKQISHPSNIILDTFVYFQTEGFITSISDAEMRKFFKQLHKELAPVFSSHYFLRDKKKNVCLGEEYNYYYAGRSTRAANITWRRKNDKLTTITITFFTKLY